MLSENSSADVLQLFLRKAIDPPEIGAMEKAWCVLEELGAVDADGRLTALGKHIVCHAMSSVSLFHPDRPVQSMLPVDLRLAKVFYLFYLSV